MFVLMRVSLLFFDQTARNSGIETLVKPWTYNIESLLRCYNLQRLKLGGVLGGENMFAIDDNWGSTEETPYPMLPAKKNASKTVQKRRLKAAKKVMNLSATAVLPGDVLMHLMCIVDRAMQRYIGAVVVSSRIDGLSYHSFVLWLHSAGHGHIGELLVLAGDRYTWS
jgi:hypothetical protein